MLFASFTFHSPHFFTSMAARDWLQFFLSDTQENCTSFILTKKRVYMTRTTPIGAKELQKGLANKTLNATNGRE
jgi:hypothetical protein